MFTFFMEKMVYIYFFRMYYLKNRNKIGEMI